MTTTFSFRSLSSFPSLTSPTLPLSQSPGIETATIFGDAMDSGVRLVSISLTFLVLFRIAYLRFLSSGRPGCSKTKFHSTPSLSTSSHLLTKQESREIPRSQAGINFTARPSGSSSPLVPSLHPFFFSNSTATNTELSLILSFLSLSLDPEKSSSVSNSLVGERTNLLFNPPPCRTVSWSRAGSWKQ